MPLPSPNGVYCGISDCCSALKYETMFRSKARNISSLSTNGALLNCALRNAISTSGFADRKSVEEAHRLIDLHVSEGLRIAVHAGPLQDSLREHVPLHLLHACVRVLLRCDGEIR